MTTSLSKAEKAFIQAGLLSNPPSRQDGRALLDYRHIALETGVAPLANGSARLSIGGGTEVLAATKLEVENITEGDMDDGRLVCCVSCSPAAYPHLSSGALDDLQHDLTTLLHQTLSHHSLHPKNLSILRHSKAWLLNVDIVVLADAGNIYDALFLAARAALWDTKVPRTRNVEYRAKKGMPGSSVDMGVSSASGDMDIDQTLSSGFDTRQITNASDFELQDYWDEGEILDGRDRWPICVTLNQVSPMYFLDATTHEEIATQLQLVIIYSFPSTKRPIVQAMRTFGPGDLEPTRLKKLVKAAEDHAHEIFKALNFKLNDEDIRRSQKARDKFAQR